MTDIDRVRGALRHTGVEFITGDDRLVLINSGDQGPNFELIFDAQGQWQCSGPESTE